MSKIYKQSDIIDQISFFELSKEIIFTKIAEYLLIDNENYHLKIAIKEIKDVQLLSNNGLDNRVFISTKSQIQFEYSIEKDKYFKKDIFNFFDINKAKT